MYTCTGKAAVGVAGITVPVTSCVYVENFIALALTLWMEPATPSSFLIHQQRRDLERGKLRHAGRIQYWAARRKHVA